MKSFWYTFAIVLSISFLIFTNAACTSCNESDPKRNRKGDNSHGDWPEPTVDKINIPECQESFSISPLEGVFLKTPPDIKYTTTLSIQICEDYVPIEMYFIVGDETKYPYQTGILEKFPKTNTFNIKRSYNYAINVTKFCVQLANEPTPRCTS